MGAMASPVLDPAGNAEYLLWGRLGSPGETVTEASGRAAVSDAGPMLAAAVAASPDTVSSDAGPSDDAASPGENVPSRPSEDR
jgi:hypothetical protein